MTHPRENASTPGNPVSVAPAGPGVPTPLQPRGAKTPSGSSPHPAAPRPHPGARWRKAGPTAPHQPPESVPANINSLTQPRCPLLNTFPLTLPSPVPNGISKFSRIICLVKRTSLYERARACFRNFNKKKLLLG